MYISSGTIVTSLLPKKDAENFGGSGTRIPLLPLVAGCLSHATDLAAFPESPSTERGRASTAAVAADSSPRRLNSRKLFFFYHEIHQNCPPDLCGSVLAAATAAGRADIVFFVNDEAGFLTANAGNSPLGAIETFEGNTATVPTGIDDPLSPGVANGPFLPA